jgi:hypothetical protein
MATSKSIRPGPARARSSNSRGPSPPWHRTGNGSIPAVPARQLQQGRQLTLIALRLRAIYGVAVTAERALREQSAEQDPEIADCLRVGVCDPIADQIEALQQIIKHRAHEGPEIQA